MNANKAISIGALWMAVAVVLGAFGAHGLEPHLKQLGSLDTWHTAVRYQSWHALGLILLGLFTLDGRRRALGGVAGWLLLGGSALFSGSLYALSLAPNATWLGPVTPLGGLSLILGWLAFAKAAWTSRSAV